MKKRLAISLALLVLFSTYKPQNITLSNKFNIKEIKIENNFILKDEEIKKDLLFLYNNNLIFLKTFEIEKHLEANSFIESFEIKKIYPNEIIIRITEKKPIVILQSKKNKYYLSENIELINFRDLDDYKNLPIVFGNKTSFKDLHKNLKTINFPLNIIKKYYLYESKRWDLETYKNKTIKLPPKNYIESLKNFISLREKNSFDKYNVFDYRIDNQLILK